MGAWSASNSVMPIYLLFAGVANVLFLYISVKDVIMKRSPASVVLTALAVAEFAWVVPCCIQCFLVFADAGDGSQPKSEGIGCDLQGFYSVFASLSGQMILTQIAYLTWARATAKRTISTTMTAVTSAGLLLLCLILALLPAFGVGEYTYAGEGFCYFDWLDSNQVAVLETVSIICMVLAMVFFSLTAIQGEQWLLQLTEKGISNNPLLWIAAMIFAYLAAWILWIPAGFIGMSSDSVDDFPDGLMISGAIFGHMTALVNPALYGIVWRSWMLVSEESVAPAGKKDKEHKTLMGAI